MGVGAGGHGELLPSGAVLANRAREVCGQRREWVRDGRDSAQVGRAREVAAVEGGLASHDVDVMIALPHEVQGVADVRVFGPRSRVLESRRPLDVGNPSGRRRGGGSRVGVGAVVLGTGHGTAARPGSKGHRGAVHASARGKIIVLRRAHKRGSIALHRMRASIAHVRSHRAAEAHRVGPTGDDPVDLGQGVVATCGRSVEMRLHLCGLGPKPLGRCCVQRLVAEGRMCGGIGVGGAQKQPPLCGGIVAKPLTAEYRESMAT